MFIFMNEIINYILRGPENGKQLEPIHIFLLVGIYDFLFCEIVELKITSVFKLFFNSTGLKL